MGLPGLLTKHRRLFFAFIAGISGCLLVSLAGWLWWAGSAAQPREAPEAERVLNAQVEMPFQALIPAYLPWVFDRARVEVDTAQPAPAGEPMLRLVYPTLLGDTLEISEWLDPTAQADGAALAAAPGGAPLQMIRCQCQCRSQTECVVSEVEYRAGPLRILVKVNPTNLVSAAELQAILATLGPAANSQVYTALEAVPVEDDLPPAVEIPVTEAGIHELTLIVSPEGYAPAHFSVKKGVPVKLTFRQLGNVGCGNELFLNWGDGQSAYLVLTDPYDKQEITFTPNQAGVFAFNCPHLIYRGIITVTE